MKSHTFVRIIFVLLFVLASGALTSRLFAQSITPESLADPDGQFIDVGGAQIYYIDKGPQDGPVVLLLHGFGGSTFTWRDTIEPLAEAGFRAIALDMPPFGLSDKDPDQAYSRANMAKTIIALMDTLKIDKASIVGHSMGGGVTAQLALNYPSRIEKLVFVAGSVGGGGVATEDQNSQTPRSAPFGFLSSLDPKSPLAITAIKTFMTPERFTDILTSAYYNKSVITDAVIAGYQRPLQLDTWAQGLLAFISSDNAVFDTTALAEIKAPTLIIWGEQDTWVPLSAGERLNTLIPNSTLIIYAETGHLPMEENTEQFNDDLLAFLAL